MANAEIIEEYLVSLGWKTDTNSANQAKKSLSDVRGSVVGLVDALKVIGRMMADIAEKMGVGAEAATGYRQELDKLDGAHNKAAASSTDLTNRTQWLRSAFADARAGATGFIATLTGLGAAVGGVAASYSRLYYQAQNAGASAGGMGALAFGIKQMGGSAEGAMSSLSSLGSALRFGGPGMESALRRFGLETRDIRGNLRDTSQILEDFFKRARSMPQYQARAWAQIFGIDDQTLIAGERDPEAMRREEEYYRGVFRRLGMDPNKAAEQSAHFMQQLVRFQHTVTAVSQKVMLDLQKTFGGSIDDLNNWLIEHSDDIAQAISDTVKDIDHLIRSIDDTATHINHAIDGVKGWKVAFEVLAAYVATTWLLKMFSPIWQVAKALGAVSGAKALGGATVRGAKSAAGVVASEAERTGAATVVRGAVRGMGLLSPLADLYTIWETWYGGSLNSNESSLLADQRAKAGLSPVEPSTIRAAVDALRQMGVAGVPAAAAIGNFMQESNLNPTAHIIDSDGKDHYGIAQWNPERMANIYKGTGIDIRYAGLADQLRAFVWETTKGGYSSFGKSFVGMKDLNAATVAFLRQYEVAADADGSDALNSRLSNAKIAYDVLSRERLQSDSPPNGPPVINQTNTYTVHGARDPQATGQAIADRQQDATARLTRNLKMRRG